MIASLAAAFVLSSPPAGTAIMIHGAGGGGWEYDFWTAEYRKAGWKVIAKDLLPAEGGLEKTTLADYLGQVEGWAKGAKRPLVLVGASMGGVLAMKAAEALKPDALILVNSVPPKGLWDRQNAKPSPPIVQWANGPLKETQDSMPDSDQKTILWAWKKWRDESGTVMDELRAGIEVADPGCVVLVVIGTQDTDIPRPVSQKVAERFKADVFQFAGMSHVGPLIGKRAREVAGTSLHWLAGQGPRQKRLGKNT